MQALRPQPALRIVNAPAADPHAVAAAAGLTAVGLSETAFAETYLDTHDARLWRNGWRLALLESGRARLLHWCRVQTAEHGEAPVRTCPRWRADLPEPCEAIGAAMDMRVLRDVIGWQGTTRSFALVDRREKTVARLDIIQGSIESGPALPDLWRVSPLKGFDDDARRVLRELSSVGAANACEDLLAWLAGHAQRSLEGYSAALDFTLTPRMSTHDAIARLLAATHATVCATHAGTLEDLDSEFLHDFRVAVRRARSWLTRMKRWTEPALFAHLQAELKWLGGITGPTRDLDVYLLKMPLYAATLPREDAAALAPLARHLGRAQKREQRRLRTALTSPRYAALMQTWGSFGQTPAPDNARTAIAPVAASVISRQWKKVTNSGRAIDPATPASALHALRIECKKLRYLLEAFASLYDPEGMRALIRALKRLQDNLGDFQDLEVQQHALHGFARTLATRNTPADTLLAMGRLIEKLAGRQQRERARFAKRWSHLDSKANNRFAKRAFSARLEQAGPWTAAPSR